MLLWCECVQFHRAHRRCYLRLLLPAFVVTCVCCYLRVVVTCVFCYLFRCYLLCCYVRTIPISFARVPHANGTRPAEPPKHRNTDVREQARLAHPVFARIRTPHAVSYLLATAVNTSRCMASIFCFLHFWSTPSYVFCKELSAFQQTRPS